MKKYTYIILLALAGMFALSSCSDDEKSPGNPTLTVKSQHTAAMFADSIRFTADVSDSDVPLSTLKVQLYFGDEKVSENIIRTKTNGEYSGKIFVPFYKDIPNGVATLKFILQNINSTIKEETFDVNITRPDYPSLTLMLEDGTEYPMPRTGLYEYAASQNFDRKFKAQIIAPPMGADGNEVIFGWDENAIVENSEYYIPFSNSDAGLYDVKFNTLTYAAEPFIIAYVINGQVLTKVTDELFFTNLALTKGQEIAVEGIDDISTWWIDPDFLTKNAAGVIKFVPNDGSYKIAADFRNKFLQVEPLNAAGTPQSLQPDGLGAIWIIGQGVGKPNVATNEVGWNTNTAISMVSLGNKKHQITLIAGKTMKTASINFKFFHQKGWGSEFSDATLALDQDTQDMDLILVNAAPNAGNITLATDKTFDEGATYVFTIDLSAGNNAGVLSVKKK